ncbi:MAG: hypothetical protein Q9201_001490 [Fulgogasparrea decipioides]
MSDRGFYDLADQLVKGFGALLEQVQELDRTNAHLEQLLARLQEQAQVDHSVSLPNLRADIALSLDPEEKKGASEDSGLHIECGDQELHLKKASPENKWFIADGFKAWNSLRRDGLGQYPHARSLERYQGKSTRTPPRSSHLTSDNTTAQCPFASQRVLQTAARNSDPCVPHNIENAKAKDNVHVDRTPEDPITAEAQLEDPSSHPPSQAGSTSKCPIRFLDQHSPEELATYFQNHSHELPRSHGICVKRYQKNEDQIKLLDRKYGSLVNMIQGLGQKHQPLLHTRVEDEMISQGRASQDKADTWAENSDHDRKLRVGDATADDIASERNGHFDRPLKEIRVGESPSRPWGISVPQGAHIPPSAASSQGEPDVVVSNEPEPRTPMTAIEQGATRPLPKLPGAAERHPSMLFTGPVFIAYTPDQITDMLQRTGLGKKGGQE